MSGSDVGALLSDLVDDFAAVLLVDFAVLARDRVAGFFAVVLDVVLVAVFAAVLVAGFADSLLVPAVSAVSLIIKSRCGKGIENPASSSSVFDLRVRSKRVGQNSEVATQPRADWRKFIAAQLLVF